MSVTRPQLRFRESTWTAPCKVSAPFCRRTALVLKRVGQRSCRARYQHESRVQQVGKSERGPETQQALEPTVQPETKQPSVVTVPPGPLTPTQLIDAISDCTCAAQLVKLYTVHGSAFNHAHACAALHRLADLSPQSNPEPQAGLGPENAAAQLTPSTAPSQQPIPPSQAGANQQTGWQGQAARSAWSDPDSPYDIDDLRRSSNYEASTSGSSNSGSSHNRGAQRQGHGGRSHGSSQPTSTGAAAKAGYGQAQEGESMLSQQQLFSGSSPAAQGRPPKPRHVARMVSGLVAMLSRACSHSSSGCRGQGAASVGGGGKGHNFDSVEAARVAHALARLGHYDGELLSKLESRMIQVLTQQQQAKKQQLQKQGRSKQPKQQRGLHQQQEQVHKSEGSPGAQTGQQGGSPEQQELQREQAVAVAANVDGRHGAAVGGDEAAGSDPGLSQQQAQQQTQKQAARRAGKRQRGGGAHVSVTATTKRGPSPPPPELPQPAITPADLALLLASLTALGRRPSAAFLAAVVSFTQPRFPAFAAARKRPDLTPSLVQSLASLGAQPSDPWITAALAAAKPHLAHYNAGQLLALLEGLLALQSPSCTSRLSKGDLRFAPRTELAATAPKAVSRVRRKSSGGAGGAASWAASFLEVSEQRLPECTPEQLVALARVLAEAGWRPGEAWLERLYGCALSMVGAVGGLTGSQAAVLLSSLAHLNCRPTGDWLNTVLLGTRRSLVDAPVDQLNDLVSALARLRFRPPEPWLQHYFAASFQRLPFHTPDQCCTAAESMARLGRSPQPLWLQELGRQVGGKLALMPGRQQSRVVAALAELGFVPSAAWLAGYEQHSNAQLAACGVEELCQSVKALVKLRFRPNASWLYSFITAAYSRLDSFDSSQLALVFECLPALTPQGVLLDEIVQICAAESTMRAQAAQQERFLAAALLQQQREEQEKLEQQQQLDQAVPQAVASAPAVAAGGPGAARRSARKEAAGRAMLQAQVLDGARVGAAGAGLAAGLQPPPALPRAKGKKARRQQQREAAAAAGREVVEGVATAVQGFVPVPVAPPAPPAGVRGAAVSLTALAASPLKPEGVAAEAGVAAPAPAAVVPAAAETLSKMGSAGVEGTPDAPGTTAASSMSSAAEMLLPSQPLVAAMLQVGCASSNGGSAAANDANGGLNCAATVRQLPPECEVAARKAERVSSGAEGAQGPDAAQPDVMRAACNGATIQIPSELVPTNAAVISEGAPCGAAIVSSPVTELNGLGAANGCSGDGDLNGRSVVLGNCALYSDNALYDSNGCGGAFSPLPLPPAGLVVVAVASVNAANGTSNTSPAATDSVSNNGCGGSSNGRRRSSNSNNGSNSGGRDDGGPGGGGAGGSGNGRVGFFPNGSSAAGAIVGGSVGRGAEVVILPRPARARVPATAAATAAAVTATTAELESAGPASQLPFAPAAAAGGDPAAFPAAPAPASLLSLQPKPRPFTSTAAAAADPNKQPAAAAAAAAGSTSGASRPVVPFGAQATGAASVSPLPQPESQAGASPIVAVAATTAAAPLVPSATSVPDPSTNAAAGAIAAATCTMGDAAAELPGCDEASPTVQYLDSVSMYKLIGAPDGPPGPDFSNCHKRKAASGPYGIFQMGRVWTNEMRGRDGSDGAVGGGMSGQPVPAPSG